MKFDLNKICLKADRPEHDIKYVVYTEHKGFNKTLTYEELILPEAKKQKDIDAIKYESYVCFANLKNKAETSSNRILFKVNFTFRKPTSLHLSLLERKRWVNLCRYYGLMPRYVGRHFIHTGNFILRFDDLSPSKIYMYLTAARYMQEYPETVRATNYLRDKGMNFYLAFLAACKCTIHNTAHSILSQGRSYIRTEEGLANLMVSPREAYALKHYAKTGYKEDNKSFSSYIKEGRSVDARFKLHVTLAEISGTFTRNIRAVMIKDLFSKEFEESFKIPEG